MGSGFSRRLAARLVFIAGLSLMILGITFLLGFLEGTSRISLLLAFFLVTAGVFYTILAARIDKSSSYLFFASFFLMSGFFIFLSALGIIPLSFSRAWPLLSVFSGLALIPAGWRHHGGFSPRYFVPAAAFVALGCVLLIFSLDVVSFSFRQFIESWWPLLFILGGLTLALISLSVRNFHSSSEKRE